MSRKEKSSSKRRKFFEVSGMISFSLLFALIIQIAVLTFDFLEDRVDVGVISVAMLIIIFFLATVASVIDAVRRKITVDRPVKKILIIAMYSTAWVCRCFCICSHWRMPEPM